MMKPVSWPETVWSEILRILAAYIYKWSTAESLSELSPEARDEIRSRIILDIMTGEHPDGLTPTHLAFRVARQWRMRGWNGDAELDRDRKRREASKAREALRDPGSAESEGARNKSPFQGMSDDSRQPTPLAQLIAIETATREGLRYVSDRQRKARRKPVKGKPAPVAYRCVPTGFAGRPRVGFGKDSRPLYFPGARTLIRFEPTGAPEYEMGAYDRSARQYQPYRSHTGTVANRAIGKKKTEPVGQDAIGLAMASMAILGRTKPRRFIPAAVPTTGIPATAGDGTAIRPCRQ
jgi:hypothetical protein